MFGSTSTNNTTGSNAFGTAGPTGFGNPSFGSSATTGTTGFGTTGFGSTANTGSTGFGTPAFGSTATPGTSGLGNTTFGTPGNTTSTAFGTPAATAFGAPTSTAFGTPGSTGFGNTAPTGFGATGSTGFGSTQPTCFGATGSTGFGTTGTTGFGTTGSTGFGATGNTGFGSTASTGFGANPSTGFGSTGTTGFGTTGNTGFGSTGSTGFGGTSFGAPTSSTNTGFGATNFGATNAGGGNTTFGSTAGSGFGTGFGTTASTGFGATGSTGFGSGFGTGGNQFSFTNKAVPSFSFGQNTATTGGISGAQQQQQQQQQSQQAIHDATLIAAAVTIPMIYHDERDKILATFNQLQAKWGIGKGFHAQSGPPVNFSPDNPFCKFRTIGYNALPTYRPEEGLVCLLINKRIEEVKNASPSFTEVLHRDVIKSPNMSVFLDSVHDMGNNQTQVVVYVFEKSPTGTGRKFTSNELMNAFEQVSCKSALASLGVVNMTEMTEISKNAVEQYLSNPPPGIDTLLWEQAKADNPDPSKLIPVPLIGFEDLSRRMKFQCNYQERQKARLEKMAEEAAELEKKCDLARGRVEELREKQYNIAHRILKVMAAFEVNRKMGFGIQSEEETLKASLEEILQEIEILNTGKLNELQVAVKSAPKTEANASNNIEESFSEDMLKLVQEKQKGLLTLITLIQDDSKKLDDIIKTLSNPEV